MDATFWIGCAATAVWAWDSRRRRRQSFDWIAGYGPLHRVLAKNRVDAALLDTVSAVLHTALTDGLVCGTPVYRYAAVATRGFLQQLEHAEAPSLAQFNRLASIRVNLTRPDWDAAARARNGWTDALRAQCATTAAALLARPQWRALIDAGLTSTVDAEFYCAANAADALGEDCWPLHWQRLQKKPQDSMRWAKVIGAASDAQLAAIVTFAEAVLPPALAAAASHDPPSAQSDDQSPWIALDRVLQELPRLAPGRGRALVLAALAGSSLRDAHLALRALESWPQELRDTAVVDALQQLRAQHDACKGCAVSRHLEAFLAGPATARA